MKDFLKTFFITGILFGLFVLIFVKTNISAGIFSGIFFGMTLAVFKYFQTKKFKKMDSTIPDILFSDGANHFSGKESVGGWLFLTKTKLIFKAHKFNINTQEGLSIELKDIVSVNPISTFGFIPNGLLISTNSTQEQFVVSGRKNWIEKILSAKTEETIK